MIAKSFILLSRKAGQMIMFTKGLKTILAILTMLTIVSNLYSCKEIPRTMSNNSSYFGAYVPNDEVVLHDAVQSVYPLDELRDYFADFEGSVGNHSYLSMSDVNNAFPIELLRSQGYTIYRTVEGGLYYVFWLQSFDVNHSNKPKEPSVAFATYLSGNVQPELFSSIEIGRSTCANTRKIDPFAELFLLLSSGIYSYSYLNANQLMRIGYKNIQGMDEEHLIVDTMDIISRDEAPSMLSSILPEDLT